MQSSPPVDAYVWGSSFHRPNLPLDLVIAMSIRLLLIVAILLAGGCRIEITAPEGGSVRSKSQNYDCPSGQVCHVDIYDLFFDDEFSAIPAPGYTFGGWRKKNLALCPSSRAPCRIVSAFAEVHPNFMKLLESDQVFFLEPVFYRSEASGQYRMTPAYDSAGSCNGGPLFYRSMQPFTIKAMQVDNHILSDFIVGNEIPDARLLTKGAAVSLVTRRQFSQTAVFSHPTKGLIDFYVEVSPNTSSKNGFSSSYNAAYRERNSNRVCGSNTYLRAEKLAEGASPTNFSNIPEVDGIYHVEILGAEIRCSDRTATAAPGAILELAVSQSGNMISFNDPAWALAGARAGQTVLVNNPEESRYPAAGTVNSSGAYTATSHARILYSELVSTWTTILGHFGTGSIDGTIEVTHIPGGMGYCTETHTFAGYRM